MYVLVTAYEWCAILPCGQGSVWCVIEDLVLFIYSIRPSCKFHWLLGLCALQCALHPTGTPSGPSSARLLSQS